MESRRQPPRNDTPGQRGDKKPLSFEDLSDLKNPFASSEASDDAGSVGPITDDQRASFVFDSFRLADDGDDAASAAETERSLDASDSEDMLESPFAKPDAEDLRISPFSEPPKRRPPPTPDKKIGAKPGAWQSTTQPTGTPERAGISRAPTIAAVRGGAQLSPSVRPKASRERINAINTSAFQVGGKTLKQVYPQFFDQKKGSKALSMLNAQIETLCKGETPLTPEQANAIYKRFCAIELVGQHIDFVVPITKDKVDAAVRWMTAPFNACTQEIARKIKEGDAYRRRDSPDVVRNEELQKLGNKVKVMVWNLWPHQSLLHHRAALKSAIDAEVKKQTDAKSMAVGLFRESSNAAAELVNSALIATAHPFGQAIVEHSTQWFAAPPFSAIGAADQHLDNLANSRAKQELVIGLAAVLKNDVLDARVHFVRATCWIVRRFLDSIESTALGDKDKRTLERQVIAYVFLNALGGYVTRAASTLPDFRQRVLIRSWASVMSALNSTVTGVATSKEAVPALLQSIQQMTTEFRVMFEALIVEIRNDPDLAES